MRNLDKTGQFTSMNISSYDECNKSFSQQDALQNVEYNFRLSQLQSEIDNLKEIEANLKNQITKDQIELAKHSHIYDVQVKLETENKRLNDDVESLKKAVDSSNTEIQREKEKVKTIAGRFRQLKTKYDDQKIANQKLQKENSNSHFSQLKHIESQRKKLYQIFNAKNDAIDGDWTNLYEVCLSMKREKDKLRQQVDAYEEAQNSPANIQLRSSVTQLEQQNKELSDKYSKLLLRNKFANIVCQQNSILCKQVNELHQFINETDTSNLRSVILAVTFTNRLLRVFNNPSTFDISALQVFNGDNSSMEIKMRDIRNKFVQLTQDLLIAKENWIDANNKRKSADIKLRQANITSEQSVYGKENIVKHNLLLKNRVLELQQELSTLISPDQYDSLKNQFETYKRRMNDKCQIDGKQVDPLYLIEENKQLKELNRDLIKENESLRILLKEKTKEILALERVVERQKILVNSQNTGYTCISIENQNVSDNLTNSTTRVTDVGPIKMFAQKNLGLASKINPAFLGL